VKRFLFLAALAAIAAPAISSLSGDEVAPAPAWLEGEGELHAYHAATIYVDGSTVHKDAYLLVRDGKVAAVVGDASELPPFLSVTELGEVTVMPGLVAADSPVTGNGNQGDRSMAAHRRAYDDFDPFLEMDRVLERGITSFYLSPDRRRLVGGRGAVVKAAGKDRVLREESDLRVSLLEEAYNPPVYFRPPVPPTNENPIVPAEVQAPMTRAGALLALRESAVGSQWGADDLHSRAMARFLRDKGTLRVAADGGGEIRGALELANAWGTPVVIDGGNHADGLAEALGGQRASVVFHPPLFTSLPDLGADWEPPAPDALRKLRDAGVSVALSPSAYGRWTWLLESAASSMAFGLNAEEALNGITKTAAEVLGVSDRVGSLATGRDADFIVIHGNPLDAAASVGQVYIEGAKVWDRAARAEAAELAANNAVVLRAGTLWSGDGAPLTGGVEVLLKDGKIVAAGRTVPHPAGARIVDAGADAHLTPGFIDARSTEAVGRSWDARAEMGMLASNSRESESWRTLARAGITTAVIGPSGVTAQGVLATAVKTAAGPGEEAYVADHRVVLMDGRNTSVTGVDGLVSGQLRAGKSYFDKWEKYRADRAKWEEERSKKSADDRKSSEADLRKRLATGAQVEEKEDKPADSDQEAKTVVEEEVVVEVDPVNGLWEGTIEDERLPEPMSVQARLFHEGEKLTGLFSSPLAPGEEVELEGTWNAETKTGTFEIDEGGMVITIKGVVDAPDHMTISIDVAGLGSVEFEANRTEIDSGPAKSTRKRVKKDAGPQPPRMDARYEGLRAIYEGRAIALVWADRAVEIRAAVNAFHQAKLPMQIVGGAEAADVADLLRSSGIGIIAPSELVRRENGADVVPAAQLNELGLSYAFQSGSNGRRAAMLPQALTMAARYGLGSEQALHGLTAGAADLLGISHRVGRLKAGLDGDVVVHSGTPFDLRTRVTHVFVNGQEVPQK
jgi:imidazolonepropionase-like amidohydrolase